jgi:hypothetical protein
LIFLFESKDNDAVDIVPVPGNPGLVVFIRETFPNFVCYNYFTNETIECQAQNVSFFSENAPFSSDGFAFVAETLNNEVRLAVVNVTYDPLINPRIVGSAVLGFQATTVYSIFFFFFLFFFPLLSLVIFLF